MTLDTIDSRRRTRVCPVAVMLGAVCLMVFPAASAFAQAGANIGGVVTDDSGGVLPGVTVTVTNKSNGVSQTLVTGAEGNYRAVALQPAPYEIKAELTGFAPQVRLVTLTVGAEGKIDFRLRVATVEESVTVSGESPLVETARSEPTSVIVAEQIATLPVLDRNFLVLAQLLPGSGPLTGGSTTFATTKFGGVADQRNGYTTIIDGGDVDDTDWGSPIVNISQDAVQEFKVFRNQFDAQYGAALTAVVTVVTKSGTNNLNGSGYYFGRDQKLDARNAFARTTPPFNQTRAGGSVGGPIAKNRTHFFGAVEGLKVNANAIVALPASNPFSSQENGIFPTPTRERMTDLKIDHQPSANHSVFVRHAYNYQQLGGTKKPARVENGVRLTANSTDSVVRTHSIVAQDSWVVSSNKVNTLRVHILKDYLATLPNSDGIGVVRPSFTWGQNSIAPQIFPRKRVTASETFYVNTPNHDLKVGGDYTYGVFPFEAHFNEKGVFQFTTDAPFNPNNSSTWPISLTIQTPGFYEYRWHQFTAYAQDDWRIGSRLHLNYGLRYDIDLDMRINGFYATVLADPAFAGLDRFRGKADAGTDRNNFQPRVGLTYDARGNGSLVLRGGWGMYVTRNRPWFQVRAQNQTLNSAVRIEDPNFLRFFPDVNAVLGGKTPDQFVAAGGARLIGTVLPDDSVLPYALGTTVGAGWQINPVTSLDIDFVDTRGNHQLGFTDLNLPATGRISASNPRPNAQFTQVLTMQNFTKSWYDALQMQLRTRVRGSNNLQVSYTLSKNILDGVDFFNTVRGTQRTPQEKGYHVLDTLHNLSFSASTDLPGQIQLSGIVRALSGSPRKISAGTDVDGDGSTTGDRPPGLTPTIGRGDLDTQLRLINEFRASINLAAIDKSLLELDPYFTVDMRATKRISFNDQHRVEVFFEGFNLTNHVNYSGLNTNMNTAAFLIRTAARPARQIQWGIRYSF
ncbi:MAG: TonB-dependent receptor [Vicinamibacterales bacterium]